MTPSRSGPAGPGSTATRATVSTADVHFLDLADATPAQLHEAALLLVEGVAEHFPRAWPTVEDGAAEVAEAMEEGRVARLAVGDRQRVLGWIGGIPMYEGRVWELHPLVVHPELQRRGIGRALVGELERIVRERGGLTIFLGTDDETEQTTLGGVDLYTGVNGQYQTSESSDSDVEPSLDIFYKLTSSLNGSLTFNTDFSATEVDDRQVGVKLADGAAGLFG